MSLLIETGVPTAREEEQEKKKKSTAQVWGRGVGLLSLSSRCTTGSFKAFTAVYFKQTLVLGINVLDLSLWCVCVCLSVSHTHNLI